MLAVERARWGLGLYVMARKLQSGVVSFLTCFQRFIMRGTSYQLMMASQHEDFWKKYFWESS